MARKVNSLLSCLAEHAVLILSSPVLKIDKRSFDLLLQITLKQKMHLSTYKLEPNEVEFPAAAVELLPAFAPVVSCDELSKN